MKGRPSLFLLPLLLLDRALVLVLAELFGLCEGLRILLPSIGFNKCVRVNVGDRAGYLLEEEILRVG